MKLLRALCALVPVLCALGLFWVGVPQGEEIRRLWTASLALAGCSNDSDRVLDLDMWWSLDYEKASGEQAKQWHQSNRDYIEREGCDAVAGCQEMMPKLTACTIHPDPSPEV